MIPASWQRILEEVSARYMRDTVNELVRKWCSETGLSVSEAVAETHQRDDGAFVTVIRRREPDEARPLRRSDRMMRR